MEIHRAGRFSVERAREQNVPMKLWSRLQKGETIEQDGVIYEPVSYTHLPVEKKETVIPKQIMMQLSCV